MNLLNVRRGQFVYYKNQLHKVYSVKPFFRQSVHLIRLKDYRQELAQAKEINLLKPRHLDSFICYHKRYTLHKSQKADIGDYILVINPSPDYLDNHYLNAIEMVASIESNGVISNRANGIKHNEYWVMVPDLLEGARIIDLQNPNIETLNGQDDSQAEPYLPETYTPKIGDVFQTNDNDQMLQTMVIAVEDKTIFLGGGIKLKKNRLLNPSKWTYLYNAFER